MSEETKVEEAKVAEAAGAAGNTEPGGAVEAPKAAGADTENVKEGGDGSGESNLKAGLLETEPEKAVGAKAGDKAPEGAPEAYEPFKFAEGFVANDEAMSAFTDFAKSKNLTQAEAQTLIDMQNKVMSEALDGYQKHIAEKTNEMIAAWEDEVRADAELGGAKLGENIYVARSAFKLLGVPEAEKVIIDSKLGSNPAIIRLLYRAGVALGEAKYVYGAPAGASDGRSAAEIIYG